nr:NmrA family transcriptional regulator [Anaerolineae bacterium]
AVYLPAGDVLEPFIDVDDIADVAVAALTDTERHAGQLYEMTGPRLMTFAQAIAELSEATGRTITYTTIPLDAFNAAMEAAQTPPDMLWLMNYLFTTVLDGRNAYLTDGVQRALGRPARDFADYTQNLAGAQVSGD